jgi:hypothetical protein
MADKFTEPGSVQSLKQLKFQSCQDLTPIYGIACEQHPRLEKGASLKSDIGEIVEHVR